MMSKPQVSHVCAGIKGRLRPSTFALKPIVIGLAMLAFALASAAARADTWQAPVGGKAIAIGEGRIACPGRRRIVGVR
jgi:hypothetical protein